MKISESLYQRVTQLIWEWRKAEAVKIVRQETRSGLKNVKDEVGAIEKALVAK